MSILIRPPDKKAEDVFVRLLAYEMRDNLAVDLFDSYQFPDPRTGKKKDKDGAALVIEKDFPSEFYHILALAAGKRVMFPRRTTVESLIRKAEVFVYLEEHNRSSDAYREIQKKFKLARGNAERIYRHVRKALDVKRF